MSRFRLPLTALGFLILVLGCLSYAAAAILDWVELAVIAGGCLLALGMAAPFAIGRLQLEVERTLQPNRVMVGGIATSRLEVRNPRSTRFQPRLLTERINDEPEPLHLPRIDKGEVWSPRHLTLATAERGIVTIGPAEVARRDPLHLVRRQAEQTGIDRLWVHPRHRLLPALPVGFAKDLEGPTSDTSPAGDVAFHTLREYQRGDNFRHIHWLSSARTGKTMVRHYVDNRRPVPLVMLNTNPGVMDEPDFETAIEVAASVGWSALHHHLPVAVWSTGGVILGRDRPGTATDLLDRLTEIDQTKTELDLRAITAEAIRSERGTSATIIVTGCEDLNSLLSTVTIARRHGAVLVVRVWKPGRRRSAAIPRARVIDVESLDQFAAAWTSAVRR